MKNHTINAGFPVLVCTSQKKISIFQIQIHSGMRTIHQWLSEYGESHQDKTNKLIHWVCVPAIFFSITGLLYAVKLPWSVQGIPVNLAMLAMIGLTLYYLSLSKTIWMGMLLFGCICLIGAAWLETSGPLPLWASCLIIFGVAWVGQFYGHHVEGKKPSFLKDLQFLLIGPAWLMSFIYKKLGLGI